MIRYSVLIILAVALMSCAAPTQVQSLANANENMKHIHDLGRLNNIESVVKEIILYLDKSGLEYRVLENGNIEHFRLDEESIVKIIFRVSACYYSKTSGASLPCNYRMGTSSPVLNGKYNKIVWFDGKEAMDFLKKEFDKAGLQYRVNSYGEIEYHEKDQNKAKIAIDRLKACLLGSKQAC